MVGAVSKMIKPSADRRRKSDRNDAEFLARMLSVGNVVEVWVPDDECEAARDLTGALEDARDDLSRSKQRLSSSCSGTGSSSTRGRPPAAGRATGPGALVLDRVDKVRGEGPTTTCSPTTSTRSGGRRREKASSRGSSRPRPASPVEEEGRLPPLPQGVDTASAADLVFEAGEFSRFRNARSFAAWVGLTPSEHSSGESDRRGAITKAGNKHLRKTLVEAAWHYLTCSGRPKDLAKAEPRTGAPGGMPPRGVRRLAERREALLARGVHGNKANVATARELACWWAVGLIAEEAWGAVPPHISRSPGSGSIRSR